MRKFKHYLLITFTFLFSFSYGEVSPVLKVELSNGIELEYQVQKPKKEPFPLLLILHGASAGIGLNNIPERWYQHWVDKGYGVATVSMPGFGNSTGERDFCGPRTIDSVNAVVNEIKKNTGFSKFGVIGFGQGSVAGALLAARRDDISCLVLANGGYDMLRHMHPEDALVNQLKYYSLSVTEAEMKLRSPMEYVSKIHSPIYLLHRVSNPIIRTDEVIQFSQALKKKGNECLISLFERDNEEDQKISFDEIIQETEKWVDNHMKA